MSANTFFNSIHLNEYEIWALIAIAATFLTLIVHYIEILLYHRITKRLKNSRHFLTQAMVQALHKPLGFIIWLCGFTHAAQFARKEAIHPQIFFWIESLRDCGSILLITWFLLRLIKKYERRIFDIRYSQITMIDKTTAHALAKMAQVIIVMISCLFILKYFFNMSFTGLWAIGGASSVIIGLAAKDLLANFFGAIMIYFDRPFSIGDTIRSPDRDIEGCVESIGWRLTCIRTGDKSPLYIPNSVFATMCIENTSLRTSRLIDETVKIRYQDIDKLEEIINQIRDMLHHHPDIDNAKSILVNLVTFGSTSLDILVYCFTSTIERLAYQHIKQDVLLQILRIVHSYGAEFAIPTHHLTIPDTTEFKLSSTNQKLTG